MNRYAAAFGVGSFVGLANELIQNPNHWCLDSPSIKSIITFTVGNVYGWSTVICLTFFDFMSKRFPNTSGILLVLAATGLVALAEGAFGQISKRFHEGRKTWQYPDCWIPFFDGYVSVVSSAFFGIGIALFYWLFYVPYLKHN